MSTIPYDGPARDDARMFVGSDLELGWARGRTLRVLLYFFERDAVLPHEYTATAQCR